MPWDSARNILLLRVKRVRMPAQETQKEDFFSPTPNYFFRDNFFGNFSILGNCPYGLNNKKNKNKNKNPCGSHQM
jgi:hypothetical protein